MRLALLALVVLGLAACGGGGRDGGGPMSIEDALRANGQTVVVEGGIVAMDGGPVRLCYALLESYPPQCGQPLASTPKPSAAELVIGLTDQSSPNCAALAIC